MKRNPTSWLETKASLVNILVKSETRPFPTSACSNEEIARTVCAG